MVYDRYGHFQTRSGPQLSVPRLVPAASAEVEGPVPNTVYKDGGDSKASVSGEDELTLTPAAVDYYKELYQSVEELKMMLELRMVKGSLS